MADNHISIAAVIWKESWYVLWTSWYVLATLRRVLVGVKRDDISYTTVGCLVFLTVFLILNSIHNKLQLPQAENMYFNLTKIKCVTVQTGFNVIYHLLSTISISHHLLWNNVSYISHNATNINPWSLPARKAPTSYKIPQPPGSQCRLSVHYRSAA